MNHGGSDQNLPKWAISPAEYKEPQTPPSMDKVVAFVLMTIVLKMIELTIKNYLVLTIKIRVSMLN